VILLVRKTPAALGLLAAILLCPGATGAAANSPNVVLITIDTLRADHLGCYGNRRIPTPVADQLAQDGVLFQRAIAQVPLTLPSHTAILTGTYPLWNGVRDLTATGLPPGIPTLAEIFRPHGYATAAFVSSIVLNSMWGLNRGFDSYDDQINPGEGKPSEKGVVDRRASITVDHAAGWITKQSSTPFFLWVHLYDPHAPYDPPEPFKARFGTRPYDGEVAYADEQLGRLIATLKSRGLYDSSLIVLMSDHGEGLGEHGEQQHGLFIYNSTVHVPLIMKLPASFHMSANSAPNVVNAVDVAPTLVQICGFPSRAHSIGAFYR